METKLNHKVETRWEWEWESNKKYLLYCTVLYCTGEESSSGDWRRRGDRMGWDWTQTSTGKRRIRGKRAAAAPYPHSHQIQAAVASKENEKQPAKSS